MKAQALALVIALGVTGCSGVATEPVSQSRESTQQKLIEHTPKDIPTVKATVKDTPTVEVTDTPTEDTKPVEITAPPVEEHAHTPTEETEPVEVEVAVEEVPEVSAEPQAEVEEVPHASAKESEATAPEVVTASEPKHAAGHAWLNSELARTGLMLRENITVIFNDEGTRLTGNCGSAISPSGTGGGCTHYNNDGTVTVYLSPATIGTPKGQHVMFHELAHANGTVDECAAEYFAHEFTEIDLWSYPQCMPAS